MTSETPWRLGSAGPERKGAPVGLRAGVHDPAEMLAEISRRAEATARRDRLDGEVGGLEEPLGQMDALALEPLVGRGSGHGDELACKGSRAHGGPGGQVGNGQRLVQVTLYPGDGVGEEAGTVEGRQRGIDVLRLPPSRWGGTTSWRASWVAISLP